MGKTDKKNRVGEDITQLRKDVDNFHKRVGSLTRRGYSVLMPPGVTEIESNSAKKELSSRNGCAIGGASISANFGIFDDVRATPVSVSGCGTKGKGYIQYGPSNSLPNVIFSNVASLPYTAAAIKYITDLTVGYGPAFMYPVSRYVNGIVKTDLIPYSDAGLMLRNRIREVREQLAEEKKQTGDGAVPDSSIRWTDVIDGTGKKEPEPGTLDYEMNLLLKDYAEWERTNSELTAFIENNNLQLHYLKCMMDASHMDIFFPTVGLSIGRVGEEWDPKIVRIGHIPTLCARMEEMDERMRINYVYYSEDWRTKPGEIPLGSAITAYPSLMPETMLAGLRSSVAKHRKSAVRRRPTWFCCPSYYPSMMKPYYPQPAWWSIFPSKVYEYATTLITDKAVERQNATMWGKMIFINNEYLRAMFDEEEADTREKKEAVRNRIYASVNSLLQRRENNGKTICLDMFVGPDGKTMQKAVEIVDVPQMTNSTETKNLLEEVSSVIFFACAVHPALIGAVPGKSGSSGGTFQRELHLLKQSQMSPIQQLYIQYINFIRDFNHWDKKCKCVIQMPVLTTLDRNNTGIEDVNSK